MHHNRRLDGLLSEVKKTAEAARDEAGLLSVFPLLQGFRKDVGPIRYDNRTKWYVCAALALLGGGFALAYFLHPPLQHELGDIGYAIMGVAAVAIVIMLCVIGFANSAIDSLSDLIFEKDVAFDNRLVEVDIDGRESDLYEEFHKAFGEFRSRGDEGRRITSLAKGAWTSDGKDIPFECYTFRYVRVYYVPVTKKIGNTTVTTMERRTETLYRYGIMLDFPYTKGIAVSGGAGSYDYDERFDTASEDFERAFSVGAVSQQTAAKFLKPAVVLEFLDMTQWFSNLNVEINRDGRMNIAYTDSDVLDRSRTSSIAEPDVFEKEIRSQLDLPKLQRLHRFADTLKKHNDSNF